MHPGRRSLRCRPIGYLIAQAWLALPLAAAAQSKAPADPQPLQRYGYEAVAVAVAAPAAPGGSHVAGAVRTGRGELTALGATRWTSASLIELPRDAAPGRYQRPHYALGFRSETLRGWLKDAGLDAQTCIAPVLRLRTKLSGDGALSGALWVYARCSFH